MGQKHTALSGEVELPGKCNGVFPTNVEPKDFQRLKAVVLSNNAFSAIPLVVSAQLSERPPIIETLTSLDLSKNKLKVVPEEIVLLANLSALRLDQNELAGLPLKFSLLFKLEKLNVSGNFIRYLPPNLGNLKNLKVCVFTFILAMSRVAFDFCYPRFIFFRNRGHFIIFPAHLFGLPCVGTPR
jgi:Leucine-rich repeat (LRR) protein